MLAKFVEHEAGNGRLYIECTVCNETLHQPERREIRGNLPGEEKKYIPTGTTEEWNGYKTNFKAQHRECQSRKRRK